MSSDNRSVILRHALELFAARGYDAVGVQEICDASAITKPTLYHYFGNKRGLLDALLGEYFGRLNASVGQAAVYHRDLTHTLTVTITAFFQFASAYPLFYRFQLALWFAPPESEAHQAVSPWHLEQYRLLETLFTQAAQDHGNMRNRQRAYATTFLGMVNTYVGMGLNGHICLDDELTYQALHQFMHGIFS